jgi:serine/threonine protein kinase
VFQEKGGVTMRGDGERDIYSLGMIFYEIFKGEKPFGDVDSKVI